MLAGEASIEQARLRLRYRGRIGARCQLAGCEGLGCGSGGAERRDARAGHATSHPNVTWLDDSLPHLNTLRSLGHRFDLILLSAVWMHVPPTARERAFRILSELLNPSGVLVITLRHGSDEEENADREFYAVSADELLVYGQRVPMTTTCHSPEPDSRRSHVQWQTVILSKPP